MQSTNAGRRRQAAEHLGQLKDGRAVKPLIVALTREERSGRVQSAVAEALAHIADPRAVPALVEVLRHHQDDFVRAQAAEILMRIRGVQTLEVLELVLQTGGGE